VSTTRFADAVAALLAVYRAASGLAGVPVYDGPQPTSAADQDFIIVGHDATMAADGTLEATALAGIFLQDWTDFEEQREERGSVNCLIVSQSGDSSDIAGRRGRAAVLLAAAEDAAAAQGGQAASKLTFDGTTDGRFITRQGAAGVAVMCAYRVSYSAPWG
jgi:hypothetical protein